MELNVKNSPNFIPPNSLTTCTSTCIQYISPLSSLSLSPPISSYYVISFGWFHAN